jgi:hypothetical protein
MKKLVFEWDDKKNAMNQKYGLFQQGKQLKRSKVFIIGGHDEKRI